MCDYFGGFLQSRTHSINTNGEGAGAPRQWEDCKHEENDESDDGHADADELAGQCECVRTGR